MTRRETPSAAPSSTSASPPSSRAPHVGKCIELELEGDDVEKARAQLDTICKDLLSNPVIEDYVLTLSPTNGK